MIKTKINITLAALFSTSALVHFAAFADSKEEQRILIKYKNGSQEAVENVLNKKNGKIHRKLSKSSLISATVTKVDIEELKKDDNILALEPDLRRYPTSESTPWGIEQVQAFEAIAGGATGEGIKVCVIDSGIYAGHEDFSQLSLTGTGDNSNWGQDSCSHGTHVAGTIAAASNGVGVVGVAPNIGGMHIVKVFDGPSCGWSYSSDLIAAAQECADSGAKVINMSLGGRGSSTIEQQAFDNLYADGVLSIAAAGNDWNDAYSYPASYNSVVSVAATDKNNQRAPFSQYNSQVELAAPGYDTYSTVPFRDANLIAADKSFISNILQGSIEDTATGVIVDGGICNEAGNWDGKIVLCKRSTWPDAVPFKESSERVAQAGGIAAVIYNNVDSIFTGSTGYDWSTRGYYPTTIPVITISGIDGTEILNNYLDQEITVSSVFESNVSAYDYKSGTSMATPHVTGVASLVWSADPSLNNRQIRQVLAQTALDVTASGKDDETGWGLVQAKDAVEKVQVGVSQVVLGSHPNYLVVVTEVKNGHKLQSELIWTAGEANVDIYLNDQLVQSGLTNKGVAIDVIKTNKTSGVASYKVCNGGTLHCSNVATVDYQGKQVPNHNGEQWSHAETEPTVLTDEPGPQELAKIEVLPNGSMFVSWLDSSNSNFDIRLQLVDKNGRDVWQQNGILVADRNFGWVTDYGFDLDASGNALIAYRQHDSNGIAQTTVNKVDSSGNLLWGSEGITLSNVSYAVYTPKIAGTTDGGAVVAWFNDDDYSLYIQKLDQNGHKLWGDEGKKIDLPPYWTGLPADLQPTVDGNVILSWNAQYGRFYRQLWAQKFDANGNTLWDEDHLKIYDGQGALQYGYLPKFVTDNQGGAIFCWNFSVGRYDTMVNAQHISSNGEELFTHNGVELTTRSKDVNRTIECTYDQASDSVFAAWSQSDVNYTRTAISAQKVDTAGNVAWGEDGISILPSSAGIKSNIRVVPAEDGFTAIWSMNSYPNPMNIQAAKIDSNGKFAWDSGIVNLKSGQTSVSNLRATAGKAGNTIVLWDDITYAGDSDLMMQSIRNDGRLGK